MINTLRWYSGVWLLIPAKWLYNILDALDPDYSQIRNPLIRKLSLVLFLLILLPACLMVDVGTWLVGKANVSRIDDFGSIF